MTENWMNFVDWLSQMDGRLLLAVNGLHTPWLDVFMWTLSDRYVWVPFYLLLAVCVFRKAQKPWKALACLLLIGLTITAADQTCSHLIRPMVERLRPSNLNNPISDLVHIVNGYRGGRYGFPSCHAANTFALAVFLSLFFRKTWVSALMLVWAVMVSFSRLCLGVHYPGDILVGMLVGSLYAVLFYRVYDYLRRSGSLQNAYKNALSFCRRPADKGLKEEV